MDKPRLLIGSCVCQTEKILEKFLASLQALDLSSFDAKIVLADDNQDERSSGLLRLFAEEDSRAVIKPTPKRIQNYMVTEKTHFWNDSLVNRVAELKNGIIRDATEGGFDYLFLIDSDLIIDPGLVKHLVGQGKDIICEIFWTSWQPGTIPMPNAWMYDLYEMVHPAEAPELKSEKSFAFMNGLRVPGVYEVGGLGACTLIAVPALAKGLNFLPVKNVSFWGEDRWFCIRAAALGIGLYIDTHFPATHLYRESDLENI